MSDRTATDLDPWRLVWGQPYIDSNQLCQAIERELLLNVKPDFRTRLLIRDAVAALQSFAGEEKFASWLTESRVQESVTAIMKEELGEPGFHNIRERLVENIERSQLAQLFELLSKRVKTKTEICIAGSVPTLIDGLTVRPTDDIDIVDEVPEEMREQRDVLEQVAKKYGFTLGHVQSHYLPANWRERLQHFGDFGNLSVFLCDPYDIFVSKLSSKKEKHRDDLCALSSRLDKELIRKRLLSDGKQFLDNQFEKPTIVENWKFVFQEPLL